MRRLHTFPSTEHPLHDQFVAREIISEMINYGTVA